MIPYQITFHDFPKSDAVWATTKSRIEKLEHFYSKLIRCEVMISCPHRHRNRARLYHVRVHLFIRGEDVVVNRNPSEDEAHRDVYVAIRDAFNAAERILEHRVKVIRHKTKVHHTEYQEGQISKVFYLDGFGFLKTQDGEEIYFGENSIINESFDHLKVGQKVKFIKEAGRKGPQVTSMSVK